MTNVEKDLDKLRILFNAVQSLEEDEPDFFGEVKQCAWNVLHENPGIDMDEWIDLLMRQYPSEVVDAIGSHPAEAYASLSEMWDSEEFKDTETGECHTFREWARKFSSYGAVDRYDKLAEQEALLRHLQASKTQKQ